MRVPYPPPNPPAASAAVLDRGRQLVMEGDRALGLPACDSCHGKRLLGVAPAVPGLLGVSQDYLTAQLGAWRMGVRAAAAPDCMKQIVQRMRAEDLNAATAWLASQPVPDNAELDPSFETTPPLKCGSIIQGGQSREGSQISQGSQSHGGSQISQGRQGGQANQISHRSAAP